MMRLSRASAHIPPRYKKWIFSLCAAGRKSPAVAIITPSVSFPILVLLISTEVLVGIITWSGQA